MPYVTVILCDKCLKRGLSTCRETQAGQRRPCEGFFACPFLYLKEAGWIRAFRKEQLCLIDNKDILLPFSNSSSRKSLKYHKVLFGYLARIEWKIPWAILHESNLIGNRISNERCVVCFFVERVEKMREIVVLPEPTHHRWGRNLCWMWRMSDNQGFFVFFGFEKKAGSGDMPKGFQ